MEQHLNYANLLSFVQVAVVFNFGLFFLRDRNTFKNVCIEFLLYLGASAELDIKNALKEIKRVRKTMPDEIKLEKEKTKAYYQKLKDILYYKESDYFFLPCIGLFSGTYGLTFLLLTGLTGWEYDSFITNLILVSGETTLLFNVLSSIILYNKTNEKEVRYIILRNVSLYILSCIASIILVVFDLLFHILYAVDHVIVLLTIGVVYFPAIVLVSISIAKMVKVEYWTFRCVWHTIRLKRMLDERRKT